MASKYQEFYKLMYVENKELFDYFKELCASYIRDRETYKVRFDEEGKKVMRVMLDWEQKLCRKMERTGKGNYSMNVAEKFREVVRKDFPCIDEVGVKRAVVG